MSRKIDYHDDPAAPEPNSLVPAVAVVVAREDGALLLIRRTDNVYWALPGGAIEMNESVAEAAVRETLEETAVRCEVTGLAGVYSDLRHVIRYTSNDEVRREFSIVLSARRQVHPHHHLAPPQRPRCPVHRPRSGLARPHERPRPQDPPPPPGTPGPRLPGHHHRSRLDPPHALDQARRQHRPGPQTHARDW